MKAHIALALLFFLIGSALHTLAQIDAIARAKSTTGSSRTAILLGRWQTILIRAAWSIALFTLWLQGQLVAVMTAAHIPVPDSMAAILDLHVGGAVAFMAGYAFDSALAFAPWLKNTIPPPIDSMNGPSGPNPPNSTAVTAKGVDLTPPKG
jgi:hypothetical protein